MSDVTDTSAAAATLLAVGESVAALQADTKKIPFFVRPMAIKGFERRTGLSLDAWQALARDAAQGLASDGGGALGRWPGLDGQLNILAEHFRGAPERAGKMMRGAALERLREVSAQREASVRTALAAVRELHKG